ncbi:MAG: MarR family transcriptional regulator, partial [Acidobacteriota bacterium]|nr:MarR family transcriptional regulator [Acidobacteriota bacterium]
THLCLSDFGVLEALLHKGPLPVSALGRKVPLSSGSMTAVVDRLERRGWVKRGFAAADRRARKLFAKHAQDEDYRAGRMGHV